VAGLASGFAVGLFAGGCVTGFAGAGCSAGRDGWVRRSGEAGVGFVRAVEGAGLDAGWAGSTVFLIGSAGFAGAGAAARAGAGAGWERFGCAFDGAGRVAAAGRAGITGAIGLPSGMGFVAARTTGRP